MAILKKLKHPKQLKKLNAAQLTGLAAEIRAFLIKSVTKTGGHLASNLGVVELTLALHYCFDSPKDKIIWDVGHQSYVHKIITGRLNRFHTLRKYGGLSGFPKTAESIYDSFGTGHSSTSISAALGLAVARDLKNEKNAVIAVIGDGSMTGGLAFEGLNNAGRLDTDLIVILNDNQMSISENVGAMSRYLNTLRTAPSYLGAKAEIKNILNKMPVIGKGAVRAVESAKDIIKHTLLNGTIFDEYGFNYIGPVDGHNIRELIRVLNRVKRLSGPVLLHVYTTKGKGYPAAEKAPALYHGVSAINDEAAETVVYNSYSSVFGRALVKLAEQNPRILAITAAMPEGTGLCEFAERFKERFFDVGIAEAHAVTFAAGLAKNGFIPVVAVYSSFLQRAYDQILHDTALNNLPVIFAADRAGIVDGDGETHQGLFDIAFLSHIPNMTIISPKNRYELADMLYFAAGLNAPVCIRYPRKAASGMFKEHNAPIVMGKAEIIEEAAGDGPKIAIIGVGEMTETAYAVSELLKKDNHRPAVINARFIKPIDTEMLSGISDYDYIFTIESAVIKGGYGQTAGFELQKLKSTAVFHPFAYPDTFIPHGAQYELAQVYGMDAVGIYKTIKGIICEPAQ